MNIETATTICTSPETVGKHRVEVLDIGSRLDGSTFGIPFHVISGQGNGPTLLIDGATHGDEIEGTLAILRMVRQLDPAQLKGTIIAVPALSVAAVEGMQRKTPFLLMGDDKSMDLNRSFPGDAGGSLNGRIAAAHCALISQATHMVSLHSIGNSCDLGPYVMYADKGDEVGAASKQLAEMCGWDIIVNGPAAYADTKTEHRGTSTDIARSRNIPAIVPEYGGDRGHLRTTVADLCNVLDRLICGIGLLEKEPDFPSGARPQDHVITPVRASHWGVLELEEGVERGSEIKQGQTLGLLYDLNGREVERAVAPVSGILTNKRIYPILRIGDWVAEIATPVR